MAILIGCRLRVVRRRMRRGGKSYAHDADYAVRVVAEALRAGAAIVILCDTNGGMLPHQVSAIVADVRARLEKAGLESDRLGAHMHNDSGCAIANTFVVCGPRRQVDRAATGPVLPRSINSDGSS